VAYLFSRFSKKSEKTFSIETLLFPLAYFFIDEEYISGKTLVIVIQQS